MDLYLVPRGEYQSAKPNIATPVQRDVYHVAYTRISRKYAPILGYQASKLYSSLPNLSHLLFGFSTIGGTFLPKIFNATGPRAKTTDSTSRHHRTTSRLRFASPPTVDKGDSINHDSSERMTTFERFAMIDYKGYLPLVDKRPLKARIVRVSAYISHQCKACQRNQT